MAFLHPIFPLLVRRPDLVLDHLGGYLALVRQESTVAGVGLLKRGVAVAMAVFLSAVFVALAGVAIMLGAMFDRFSWTLVLVPGAVLLLIAAALWIAKQPTGVPAFAELQAQIDADRQLLRAAAEVD